MKPYQQPTRKTGAYIARASYAGDGAFGALWDSERRGAPLIGPRGIDAPPKEGDNLVMLPHEGGDLCAGALCDTAGLQPGELRLRSAGGAEILLKNDGSVSLNGVIISPEGQIIPKGGS